MSSRVNCNALEPFVECRKQNTSRGRQLVTEYTPDLDVLFFAILKKAGTEKGGRWGCVRHAWHRGRSKKYHLTPIAHELSAVVDHPPVGRADQKKHCPDWRTVQYSGARISERGIPVK
jgi:hypothetical protein